MNYKPSQQEAIDHLDSNVIVPASAGAGKTAVLIARLMKRIIVDEVELDEICAMTFTEAAASEMKVRLMKALNEKFEEEPSDFITKQISLLETAHISTIHSFCLNIVKNYGYIIGIDPDQTQNILPPAEQNILKEEAIALTIESMIQEDFEKSQYLLEVFSSNPLNFKSLEDAIVTVYEWYSEQSNPQYHIDSLLETYQAQSIDELSQAHQDVFYNYYLLEISTLIDYQSSAYEMATLALGDTMTKLQAEAMTSLENNMGKLVQIKGQIENRDPRFYDDLPYALDTFYPRINKHPDYSKASKSAAEVTSRLMENHRTLSEEFTILNGQYPIVQSLIQLAQNYEVIFKSLKQEKKALDFSDFEPLALEILLAENGAVASLLQAQFKEIMVDEFQDTNSYQDAIIRLISNGKNIFRVGDVKQSIYGFRGGKPEIMQGIIRNNEAKKIAISYNFRSKTDIVHFNNVTFKNIMDLTINSKYTEDDIVEPGTTNQDIDSAKVEFHIIETYEEAPEEDDFIVEEVPYNDGSGLEKPSKTDPLSAYHISQEIIKLVSSGQFEYRDITILVRAHHLKDRLKEAFEAVNIPYFLNEQTGFYRSKIVESTLDILKYLDHKEDYYLAKALLSPYFNMSMDSLAQLKLDPNSLYKALEIHHPETYLMLDKLKYQAKNSDIITLLQGIFALNDAYNTVFSIQDKTNIDALLDKAVQFQSNNPITITGFISFIESLLDERSAEASPISSDENVVTAMTIHQSKGLQFPVVFVFGLGRHSFQDSKSFLIADSELGIAMNHIDLDYRSTQKTLLRKIMMHKKNHDELEESMRLLYVALTRAEKRMIIVDVMEKYERETLDFNLLFNHKRKINLLIPASMDTAKVEIINRIELNEQSLDKIDYSLKDNYQKLEPIVLETGHYELPFTNETLNLDRSYLKGMEYGTQIHEAIEHLPNDLWTQDAVSSYTSAVQRTLMDYNTHPKTQDIYQNHESFYHEMPYIAQIDGDIRNGIMDYVALAADKVTLVDFKTDNADVATILERYTNQVEEYKKALELIYPGLQIQAYIYSFHLKDYINL